jgi:hypothetical protein
MKTVLVDLKLNLHEKNYVSNFDVSSIKLSGTVEKIAKNDKQGPSKLYSVKANKVNRFLTKLISPFYY